MKKTNLYERSWATVLIVAGVVLLGVVFFSAFAIVKDPGGSYNKWVPSEAVEDPEASFEWASSGLAVEFVDTSSVGDADIERWAWNFGDGTESADPNPSHRFPEDGEFAITLDVVDGNGLSSRAEAAVGVETGADNSGQGTLGLNDLADSVIDAVERGAKGSGVVLLVVGLFVVLTMVGGRLLRQGVRALRPIPDRISVKLRPKNLELAVTDSVDETRSTTEIAAPPPSPAAQTADIDTEDQ